MHKGNEVLNDVIAAYAGLEGRVICFTETKKEANEMVMSEHIKYDCQALHGDIPQSQRETTVAGFKRGTFRVLVATDVAARGLDITGVSLVVQNEPPQSYETYVHRSGRTGRANTKGISVLFFTAKQRWYVEQIERHASIKFRRIGPPNSAALIKSSIGLIDEKLGAVSDEIVPYFREKAKELLEEDGEEKLARALAVVSGHTRPISKRSIMSASKGYVTVLMQGTQHIRSLTYVWNAIRKHLFSNPDDKVRAVKLTKDKLGAVFEIPDRYEKDVLESAKKQSYFEFSIPRELPELDERQAIRPDPPRWRKGGRGGRGRRGGRRGGRSRGGRGRGRRGGGRFNRRKTF